MLKGSIRKRGQNTYQVRIFLGKDAQGRHLSHTKTIHGTKKDAEKYAREAVYRIDAGNFAVQSDLTLEEFWNSQKSLIKQRVQRSTFDYKEGLWCSYIAPTFASKRLQTITPAFCSAFISMLLERRLGPFIIRRIIQDLKALLNIALRLGLIKTNPCKGIELPRLPKSQIMPLSKAEIKDFLTACEKDPRGLLLRLAILTGTRPEEYLALTWQDVDFNKGTISIKRAVHFLRKAKDHYIGDLKNASSCREIFLDLETLAKLKALWKERKSSQDFIFQNKASSFINISTARNALLRVLKKAGIERDRFRLYDLRHSHASFLLSCGVPVQAVASRLGHSSPVTTMKHYIHSRPEQGKEVARVLTDIFAISAPSVGTEKSAFIPVSIDNCLPLAEGGSKGPNFSTSSAFFQNKSTKSTHNEARGGPLKPLFMAI